MDDESDSEPGRGVLILLTFNLYLRGTGAGFSEKRGSASRVLALTEKG